MARGSPDHNYNVDGVSPTFVGDKRGVVRVCRSPYVPNQSSKLHT
jgi:hypothetical protein